MIAAGEKYRWRRCSYPLQAPSEGTTELCLGPSSRKKADESSLYRLQTATEITLDEIEYHQDGAGNRAERYSTTSQPKSNMLSSHEPSEEVQAHDRSPPELSLSQRSRASPSRVRALSGTQRTSSPVRLSSSNQNHEFRMLSPWTRNMYPLGATMDATPEVHSPTSPPQDGLEKDARAITTSEISPWQREAYPLNSTVNGSAIRNSPPPLPEKGSRLAYETCSSQDRHSQESSTDSGLKGPQIDSPHSSSCRSTTSAASPSSSRHESEKVTEIIQISSQAATESKAWPRQKYPLQTLASDADLWARQTPPQSPGKEPNHIRKPSTDQSRESDQRVTKSRIFRRQIYPLQSPACNMNPRPSIFPSSSMETSLQETDEPPKPERREHILATKTVNQWRRQVYPLQSIKSDPPFQLSSTPQAPEAEIEKDYTPPPIYLPKHITAVTDAENHDFKGRTIVVCLDGTGDKFDNDNSNIVHLISALKKDDARQMTYYQAGVGTYGAGGLSGGVTAAMDMAVGSSLGLHVRDAYHFLMHTYKEGDRICIFGFSRGAYTARCLAGMIHKVGLLPPRNIQQISFAYEFYAKESLEGWEQSADFKKTFSIDISVYFLGCFDSVASVGLIPRQLPLSSTPSNKPRYFRHAMALDERRVKFEVCRHQEKDWDDVDVASPENKTAFSTQSDRLRLPSNCPRKSKAPLPEAAPQSRYGTLHHPNLTDEEHKRLTAHDKPFDTDVLEVWFAGAHADIGGGAVPNDERHKLAQIPLRWMIRQAFECNTGILFKTAILAEHGLDVHMLWPKYERHSAPTHGPPPSLLGKYEKGLPPKSIRRSKLVPIDKRESGEEFFHLKSHTDEDWTPEQVEDFYDAMSPLNDQLVQAPSWWILEVLPVRYHVPVVTGIVSDRVGMNLGRYRGVEETEPKLHWTVLHRVQHTGYRINARVAPHVKWQTAV